MIEEVQEFLIDFFVEKVNFILTTQIHQKNHLKYQIMSF
jgi:hypothetical protein